MPLVALEAAVFDPWGAVLLDASPDSTLDTHTRRVTRTATLDGHSVIIDHGYTAADATLAIRAVLDPATAAALVRLMRIYPAGHLQLPRAAVSSGSLTTCARTAAGRPPFNSWCNAPWR